MHKWLTSQVRRVVRVVVANAPDWTGLVALALPLGVIILIVSSTLGDNDTAAAWAGLATALMVAGFVSFIAGWGYTIRRQRRRAAAWEKEDERQRQVYERRRQDEHIAYIKALRMIRWQLQEVDHLERRLGRDDAED